MGLRFDMANLTTNEKQLLEKIFNMGGGYVLNFTDRTLGEFFENDVGVNIYDEKYNYASGSKANRIRGFWIQADDKIVAKSINCLLDYIENQILLNYLPRENFQSDRLIAVKEIVKKLDNGGGRVPKSDVKVTYQNGNITIRLQKEVFDHVQKLLRDGHYFNAVEEAYKIVRKKLKEITNEEKAHQAFAAENYIKIFGREAVDDAEKDFFEGVKFLHMAIQFLRNEKAHTPAKNIDENLAIHYISLASLAYDLISRK